MKAREDLLKTTMALSTMRLFGYVGKLIRKTRRSRKRGIAIDKKQYAAIKKRKWRMDYSNNIQACEAITGLNQINISISFILTLYASTLLKKGEVSIS